MWERAASAYSLSQMKFNGNGLRMEPRSDGNCMRNRQGLNGGVRYHFTKCLCVGLCDPRDSLRNRLQFSVGVSGDGSRSSTFLLVLP